MARIYDMARSLDNRGVIGPAMEAGNRIRQGRASARISELQAEEAPKEIARKDEAYQRQQELQQKSDALGDMRQTLSVAQTPQTFIRSLDRLFEGNLPPMIQQIKDEAESTVGQPQAFEKLKGDVLAFAAQFKAEHDRMLEEVKGIYDIAQEEKKGEEARKTESVKQANRKDLERTKAALKKDFESYKSDLAEEKGITTGELTRIEKAGRERFEELFWDNEEGEWREDAPGYMDGQIDPKAYTNWLSSYIDSVQETAGKSKKSRKTEKSTETTGPTWKDYQ